MEIKEKQSRLDDVVVGLSCNFCGFMSVQKGLFMALSCHNATEALVEVIEDYGDGTEYDVFEENDLYGHICIHCLKDLFKWRKNSSKIPITHRFESF